MYHICVYVDIYIYMCFDVYMYVDINTWIYTYIYIYIYIGILFDMYRWECTGGESGHLPAAFIKQVAQILKAVQVKMAIP